MKKCAHYVTVPQERIRAQQKKREKEVDEKSYKHVPTKNKSEYRSRHAQRQLTSEQTKRKKIYFSPSCATNKRIHSFRAILQLVVAFTMYRKQIQECEQKNKIFFLYLVFYMINSANAEEHLMNCGTRTNDDRKRWKM